MKTAFLYATKYGCVEQCGKIIAEKLNGVMDFYNLKANNNVDLTQYDRVILGGSIYVGKIQKEVTEFSLNNLKTLKNKKLGLFICCLMEGEEAETQLRNAYPETLLEHAAAKEYLGGQAVFNKMNFFHSFILKKVAKTDKDVYNLSNINIERFVNALN
ncbi:flavodoxin domain-containing protein [Anaerocolumna aminovalerica]|uniref:flavodoxin domain-containing protein n=1 Tax=Anaerocolumna aminovalerica TaxID=1527 RepID=UPI000BE2B511|nr:flavodoxin domain-containing protein [Anaerocolumna aminovalerica]